MKAIKSRLTMKKIQHLFYDRVNGKGVYLYVDCFGEKYMAQLRFGMRLKKD